MTKPYKMLLYAERARSAEIHQHQCGGNVQNRESKQHHHGVLLYYKDDGTAEADLTLSTVRTGILAIANSDQENIAKLVTTESGDMTLFEDLCTSMTTPELYFNIIEP